MIWIALALAWLIFLYTARNGGLRSLLPACFAAGAIALGLDVLFNLNLNLYEYRVPGLANEWAILLLGWLGYPVLGALFARYLPADDTHRAAYALAWTAILVIVEVLALRYGGVAHTGWQLWWSPFLYLGALIVLLLATAGLRSARPSER